MARSSGEQPRDVKRRSARRGGSIPPRAKQQEKSIFCNKHPRLKRYSPQKGGRRAGKFTLAARKDEQKTNNNRLKRFGQRTFFLAAGKTANKRRFTDGLAAGAKTAALMADIAGIARVLNVNPSSFNASDSLFSFAFDAKHLARAPGSIPGSAPSLQRSPKRKEGKNEA